MSALEITIHGVSLIKAVSRSTDDKGYNWVNLRIESAEYEATHEIMLFVPTKEYADALAKAITDLPASGFTPPAAAASSDMDDEIPF